MPPAKPGQIIVVRANGWRFVLAHQTLMCVIYFALGVFSAPWLWSVFK